MLIRFFYSFLYFVFVEINIKYCYILGSTGGCGCERLQDKHVVISPEGGVSPVWYRANGVKVPSNELCHVKQNLEDIDKQVICVYCFIVFYLCNTFMT